MAFASEPSVSTAGMVNKLDGTGKRILVIDDDLAIRVLLQAVLRRMKFEVELAEDGAVGLDKVRPNGHYDVILLNRMVPGPKAKEFTKKTPEERRDAGPHIIFSPAGGKRGGEKTPANAVCNSILKPFDLEKFIEMIRECIGDEHQTA